MVLQHGRAVKKGHNSNKESPSTVSSLSNELQDVGGSEDEGTIISSLV